MFQCGGPTRDWIQRGTAHGFTQLKTNRLNSHPNWAESNTSKGQIRPSATPQYTSHPGAAHSATHSVVEPMTRPAVATTKPKVRPLTLPKLEQVQPPRTPALESTTSKQLGDATTHRPCIPIPIASLKSKEWSCSGHFVSHRIMILGPTSGEMEPVQWRHGTNHCWETSC